jgi:pimeloyl-ACP methyl ester carboxylesterase
VLDAELRFIDEGPRGAASTLLVIPGHTARIEGFDAMVPQLSQEHRVVVADLPGSGYSEKPERVYDLRYYEDVLVGLIDALGLQGVVPVGGSLGGNLVLRLGHRFPDRFERLVVWAPGSAWPARPGLARLVRRCCGPRLFWTSVRVQSRYWYGHDFPGRETALRETFDYYREVWSPGFVQMYWGLAADQLEHSLFDLAPAIAQSTLLLWGDQDHGGGMGKGVARLHELLPNDELVVFEGARHSLEAEIPERLSDAILRFLRRAT